MEKWERGEKVESNAKGCRKPVGRSDKNASWMGVGAVPPITIPSQDGGHLE